MLCREPQRLITVAATCQLGFRSSCLELCATTHGSFELKALVLAPNSVVHSRLRVRPTVEVDVGLTWTLSKSELREFELGIDPRTRRCQNHCSQQQKLSKR